MTEKEKDAADLFKKKLRQWEDEHDHACRVAREHGWEWNSETEKYEYVGHE